MWAATSGDRLTTLHVDRALTDCVSLSDGKRIVAVGAADVYFLRLWSEPDHESLAARGESLHGPLAARREYW
jgi:hypothetical protein